MPAWTRVIDVADCPQGASEHVVDGRIVGVFRREGKIYALDGVCSHQGGPLGKGELEEEGDVCYVTCPWHGWQFNISNGCHRTSPLRHASMPVKVEDGAIFVDLEA